MSLLKIGGDTYIIDFKKFEDVVGGTEADVDVEIETILDYNYPEDKPEGVLFAKKVITKSYPKGKEIDISKYETLRLLIEIVMNTQDEIDESLGAARGLNKLPIPFKVAFNTLKFYGILKNVEL